jgi:hypothetical protein
MEFLQANWLWLLIGLGAVWLFFGRGGMGCGRRDHGSHGDRASTDAKGSTGSRASLNRQGSDAARERDAETPAAHRHRGC